MKVQIFLADEFTRILDNRSPWKGEEGAGVVMVLVVCSTMIGGLKRSSLFSCKNADTISYCAPVVTLFT